MIDPEADVLTFDELRVRVLDAIREAELVAYAISTTLDLDDMSRELSFCVVPRSWTEPFRHRAQIEITYDVVHAAASVDPEGRPDDPEDIVYSLEVQLHFHLVGPGDGVPMTELKPYAKPRLDRLNAALGDERPLQIYYTVSTDYAGKDLPVSAEIPYLVELRLLSDEFDLSELIHVLKVGLDALGPPDDRSAGDGDLPKGKRW